MTTVTALNGRLPDSLLTVVDTGPNGPQRLHVSVAPIWAAMLRDGMPGGCLRSGYRTLGQQAAEHTANPAGAAPPGESQHGEGMAFDVDEPARTWARAHAATYGIRFPVPTEAWHGELDQARLPARTPAPPALLEETDMAKHYYVVQTGQHYLVTEQNVQTVQSSYVDTVTVQWGAAQPVNAATITQLQDLVHANAKQAAYNAAH